jgi:hypothetical protein
MDPEVNPTRGKGDRNTECAVYRMCLSRAIREDWSRWTCERCDLYSRPEKTMSACGSLSSEERPQNRAVVMCRNCGERPAMLNGRTGKPVNGRCGHCHSRIMRNAVRAKQEPKRRKPPAPAPPKREAPLRAKEEPRPQRVIEISFEGREDLLDRFNTEAAGARQTPAEHMLWLVGVYVKGLDRSGRDAATKS